MNVDLNELYTLAKAATPGPWFNDSEWSSDDVSIWSGEPGDSAVFLGNVGSTPFVEVGVAFDINAANGKFIAAANPDVVLHLIERIRQLESKTSVTMGVGDGSGQSVVGNSKIELLLEKLADEKAVADESWRFRSLDRMDEAIGILGEISKEINSLQEENHLLQSAILSQSEVKVP